VFNSSFRAKHHNKLHFHGNTVNKRSIQGLWISCLWISGLWISGQWHIRYVYHHHLLQNLPQLHNISIVQLRRFTNLQAFLYISRSDLLFQLTSIHELPDISRSDFHFQFNNLQSLLHNFAMSQIQGPYALIYLPFDPSYASDAALFNGEIFHPHLWLSGEKVPGYEGTWNQIGEGFLGCGPQWDRPTEMRPPHAPSYLQSIFRNWSSVQPSAPPSRHHRLKARYDPLRARYLSNRSAHLAKNMPTVPGYINPSDYHASILYQGFPDLPVPSLQQKTNSSMMPVFGSQHTTQSSTMPVSGSQHTTQSSTIPVSSPRHTTQSSIIPVSGLQRNTESSITPVINLQHNTKSSTMPVPSIPTVTVAEHMPQLPVEEGIDGSKVLFQAAATTTMPAPSVRKFFVAEFKPQIPIEMGIDGSKVRIQAAATNTTPATEVTDSQPLLLSLCAQPTSDCTAVTREAKKAYKIKLANMPGGTHFNDVKTFVEKTRKSFDYRIEGPRYCAGNKMEAEVYVKTVADVNLLCSGLNGLGMSKAGEAVNVYEVLGEDIPDEMVPTGIPRYQRVTGITPQDKPLV
jgi:hypothetical protein